MMRYGVDLAAVEFLDRRTIVALNRYRGFGLEEQPSLFLEVHGSPHSVDDVFGTAQVLCEERGGALDRPARRTQSMGSAPFHHPGDSGAETRGQNDPNRYGLSSLTFYPRWSSRAMLLPSDTGSCCIPLATPGSVFYTPCCVRTRPMLSAGRPPSGQKMKLWRLSCGRRDGLG